MKKNVYIRMAAILAAVLLAAAFSAAAEENDTFIWSEPGKYLTTELQAVREIRNREEADAYMRELWAAAYQGLMPEGTVEMEIDPADQSYHYGVIDEEGCCVYSANFLSNGLVQALTYYDGDSRWIEEGEYSELKPETLDQPVQETALSWLAEMAEELDPGVTKLIQPMQVWRIRDVGDRLYIGIYAAPAGDDYETGLNATVVYEDGSCFLYEYSLYGAG